MKKTDNSVRVDVRIPEDIYSEIEKIAIATNQPYTPKSKNTDKPKPVVTPIILKLLELGLDSLARQGLELDNKEISDLEADIKLTDLEDRIVKRLESHLRKLVDEQVTETISQYEHFSKILEDEDLNIALNQLSDISDLEADIKLTDLEDITPEDNSEIKSFDKAVIEIKRLKEQGLGNTAIAKELTGKYFNKSGTGTKWSDTQVRRELN